MADISVLARLLNGAMRNVDLTNNTPVVLSIKVGGGVSNTELTKAILDRLVSTQNGSDLDATYHTHDGRYFTETELGSATASSGSDLIGDDDTYSNFTPTAATVKGALEGIDSALATAGGTEFSDDTFRVYDNDDNTKKIALEASAITTGTTRTVTMPDANVDLADVNNAILKDGSREFTASQSLGGFNLNNVGQITGDNLIVGAATGDLSVYTAEEGNTVFVASVGVSGKIDLEANGEIKLTSTSVILNAQSGGTISAGSNKIADLADPTLAQDAATKAYVDGIAQGLEPKGSVVAASTGNVDIATGLEDGDTLDGVTLATGDRVLLKDQTDATQNGVYIVVASGAASRASDFDGNPDNEVKGGDWVYTEEGTANGGTTWAVLGQGSKDVGTDDINFTKINKVTPIQGGDAITISSDTVNVNVDDSTIEISSDALRVKAAGITEDHLAASVAGAGLTGGAGSALAVNLEATDPSLQIASDELGIKFDPAGALSKGAAGTKANVDDSTIEIATNALQVKDAGITLAKLAADSVDENKLKATALGATLSGGSGTVVNVVSAPLSKKTMVAGEAFAANTSFLVRFAMDGETAGRVYKADKDASTEDKFYAMGIALSTGAVSAGDNIEVVMLGTHTLGGSDTAFGGTDIGKAVFLTSAGAFSVTAPSAVNEAVVRIGMVEATDKIFVQGVQVVGVN